MKQWQQHVALIYHSVCTGRATSCRNTLLRQIASCVLHNFCGKSVSKIAFCSCRKSQKIKSDNLCDFLRRQNSVAETKIFTKILQYTQRDLSLQRVAATLASTCRLVGTDLHWSFRWAKILLFYLIYFGSSDSPLNNINSVSYFWSSCWPLSYKICDTFGKGLSFLFS